MSDDYQGNQHRDIESLKSQLIEDDGTISVYDQHTSNIFLEARTVVVSSIQHGHDFIVGHPTNSVIGVPALGIDGSQIAIGITGVGIGSPVVLSIVNANDTYEELLRHTAFVDSGATTATVDTTSMKINF